VFLATLLDFDKVFMIGLGDMHESPKPESLEVEDLPKEIQKLLENREKARKNKEWEKADALRSEIKSLGYEIVDTDNGVKITKIT